MLKLYDYPDCPYGQKVRVVLAEKELEYETALVDLRKQEQRTPEFLRLNPLGKVPGLGDGLSAACKDRLANARGAAAGAGGGAGADAAAIADEAIKEEQQALPTLPDSVQVDDEKSASAGAASP